MSFFFSPSFSHTAQIITALARQASSTAAKRGVSQLEWVNRSWVTEAATQHEKVLLEYPMLNSLAAQLLLKAAPLNKLLSADADSLSAACPLLNPTVIEVR